MLLYTNEHKYNYYEKHFTYNSPINFSLMGQVKEVASMDMSLLTKGLYILKVEIEGNGYISKLIIKN